MARNIIRQWYTSSNPSLLLQSESRLLSALVKHPFHKPSETKGLNWLEFRANEDKNLTQQLPSLVLAHGFGSGSAFFYRNIDDLLNSGKISRVICVDWMGMGGSPRPSCWESPVRSIFSSSRFSFCNSKFSSVEDAIDFFLEPIDILLRDDTLFEKKEPIWLVGHSLGGYLASKYAMRLSSNQMNTIPNLTKLILASPVGFQPLPTTNERIQTSELPPTIRLVDALWSSNFTPQQIVRMLGSTRGLSTVKRALHGRIPQLQSSELDLLADYLYHITVAPASGEYAMNSLLEPAATKESMGVFAREPLGGGSMANSISKQTIPSLKTIRVLYGSNDWMRFHEQAARHEMQRIQSEIRAEVQIIPNAGHHLYLDNSSSFAKHILDD